MSRDLSTFSSAYKWAVYPTVLESFEGFPVSTLNLAKHRLKNDEQIVELLYFCYRRAYHGNFRQVKKTASKSNKIMIAKKLSFHLNVFFVYLLIIKKIVKKATEKHGSSAK